MREILFRGKRESDGKWQYGMYSDDRVHETDFPCIFPLLEMDNDFDWSVLPETVGQYTGLTDKNGKKIFEDDILLIEAVCSDPNYTKFVKQVIFHKGKFCVTIAGWSDFERTPPKMCEVIGNIFDNPELLEGSTE